MEQVASQHRDKMAYILNSLEHQVLSQRKKIISSDSNVKCTRAKSILSAEHAKVNFNAKVLCNSFSIYTTVHLHMTDFTD